MAGQIGIKTNLVLDKSKLDSQIEKIQEILAKKNTFKIDVDKESINNLKEIHKIVKDIVKAIDFDLDDFKKKIKSASSSSSDVGFGDTSMLQQQANEQDKVLEKSANNKMNLLKTTKVFQDGILKQEKMDFINTEKEKYAAVLKYTQDGISVTESLEKKSGGSRLKELRKELESIQKSFKSLGKIDGFKDMPDFGNLFRSMNKLDKAYSGELKVFDTKGYEKLKDTLSSLGEAYDELSKKANGKKDSLDVTKSILNSRKAVKQLSNDYQSLKRVMPEFDPDGTILKQITDVESKMEKINKTSTGTGSNAFKELDISITNAKDSLDAYSKEFDSMLNKDKKIEALRSKLSTLEIFADKGVLDTSTVNKFKDSIESLYDIKDPREFALALNNITKELNRSEKGAKQAERAMRGLGNESHGIKRLSDALAKMGIYFSAWRITSEIFQEFKRGIKTVSELDNQIVQVGIDMNVTAGESKKLLSEAQRIAVETGIGIEEIVRVAGVYSNETENMASVLAKVKPSAILAGIASGSATEITDMFQGVVNQYQLAKDDIEKTSYEISDSIIGVSKNIAQNFDTSVREISEVMLDAGAVMNELGYTYQETMAMAGAVMEVTRQTGSEIGGAFRMIGARIGGAKNTGEDLDPEEISNAAKAYKSVGIEIVDADGNFKDMKDTLAELSLIWDDLTDVERSYIAEQSAGNRRRNTFMVMMETMGKQTELTNIALNSQGDTLAANDKYLESTGAKVQNFTNALNTLWQNTISSNSIKAIVDFGTGFVKVADSIGIVNIAIVALSTYLMTSAKVATFYATTIATLKAFYNEMAISAILAGQSVTVFTAKTVMAKVATIGLAIASKALLVGAFAAVVIIVGKLITSYESASKKMKRLKEEMEDTNKSLDGLESNYKKLADAQKSVDIANSGKANVSMEDKKKLSEELLEVQRQIARENPNLITAYDEEGNALATNSDLIREQILLQQELRKEKAINWLETGKYSKDALKDLASEAKGMQDNIMNFRKMMDAGQETYTAIGAQQSESGYGYEMVEVQKSVAEAYQKSRDAGMEFNDKVAEINAMLEATGDESLKALKIPLLMFGLVDSKVDETGDSLNGASEDADGLTRSIEKLNDAIKESEDKMNGLNKAMEEIDDKDFNGISSDSVQFIIDNYPHLLQYIGDEKKLRQELAGLYEVEKKASSDALAVKILNLNAEGKAHFDVFNKKVQNDEEWYRVTILNNQELVKKFNELYGIDFRRYTTLLDAKNASERRYIATTVSNFNGMFGAISQGYAQLITQSDAVADKVNADLGRYGKGNLIESDYNGGAPRGKVIYRGINVATQAFNAISWSGVNPNVGTGSGSTSGKDSEKTKYESDEAYFNKHTALIEEYQRQLEILESKISKTTEGIAYYKELGTDSALNNALILQNRLYQEQASKVQLLQKAQADMIAGRNEIASSMSKLGINMSTQTAEDINYWLDKLYPKVTSTNQAVVDAQNAKREAFEISWDAYMSYAGELVDIESEIVGMQSELLQVLKGKYEIEFELIDRRLENFSKRTRDINRNIALLDDSASYNTRESMTSDALSSLMDYRNELQATIRTLENKMKTLSSSSEEWAIINEQLEAYRDTLYDANLEIKNTQDALKDLRDQEYSNAMSMLDKIAATVRTQYQLAKEAEIKALKAAMDAEISLKRKEIDILQQRLEALNDTREDKESELRALRDEAKMWENDNSVFAKRQLAELQALIKEKEKELEKDRIQGEIDNLEEEIDAIEESNQDKENAINEAYDELLKDQNVYQEASRILMTSSQEEILQFMLSYDEKYKGMGSVLGAAFATGLLEEIAKGLDSFHSLTDGLFGSEMIPYLQSLPENYTYSGGTVSANSGIGVQSLSSVNGDYGTIKLDVTELTRLLDFKKLSSSFTGESNIEMIVNFYNYSQIDVDKNIRSLKEVLMDATAGSGVMLKINR